MQGSFCSAFELNFCPSSDLEVVALLGQLAVHKQSRKIHSMAVHMRCRNQWHPAVAGIAAAAALAPVAALASVAVEARLLRSHPSSDPCSSGLAERWPRRP